MWDMAEPRAPQRPPRPPGARPPVRGRILDEIEATGPVRAADIARELGIPANQASFHLRQLAKYGLVEEAPEEARDKRDRVWRSAVPSGYTVSLSELEQAPGGRAAVEVFRQNKRAWGHHVVDRAFATGLPEGSGVFSVSDHALRLTDDEAQQLLRGDRRAGRGVGRAAPGAATLSGAPTC